MSSDNSGLIGWFFILSFILFPLAVTAGYWCKRVVKVVGAYDQGPWIVWSWIFRTAGAIIVPRALMQVFWTFNDIKSEGVSYETDLNAQYVQNANVLSTYVSSFEEQLGVANLQGNQVKAIITEAVAGQVSVRDLVSPGSSPLFIAVKQAYPNVTLPQYNQLINYIQQGRKQFQDGQSDLLKKLSAYDNWRHTGFLIQPALVNGLGFPTNLLHADVGGKRLTGAAAEAQMWKIVENPTAAAAFASGVEQPIAIH
jgi:hypothetical protein